MIKVNEILDLSLFSNFKVLYGEEYLSNEVTATVILEYESSRIQYEHGIILICSFINNEIPTPTSHKISYIKDIMINVGFTPNSFHIGICDTALPLKELNIAVRKALNANTVCNYENAEMQLYSEMGVYKYIMALVNNTVLYADIEKDISILQQYDEEHDSNLLETLIIHITNNGDFNKTSSALFQHTNTVRYRIKKAEQLLSLPEDTAYEEIILLIRSYLLHSTVKQT